MKFAPRAALLVVIVAAVVTLVCVPIAGATEAPAPCAGAPSAPVFAPWLDGASYFLGSNGGFEAGATDWTLTRGAGVVTDNESYHLNDATDSHSLNLPAGSSAVSRPICVNVSEPTVRMFVKAPATLGSALLVEATVRYPTTGVAVTIPYVVIGGVNGGRWAPTLPILVGSALSAVGRMELTVQLTPIGVPANWRVDDVYVDPFKSR